MKYYNFQILTTNPDYTFDQLSYDVGFLFVSLEENPFITSVDIFNDGGNYASLLIASDILTIQELESLLLDQLKGIHGQPENYVLLTPEAAEV